MRLGIRKSFKILAPGSSLRRRVGYSLAVVRLILVPVIFLAVYYLFEMGWIVDRIVNVDAPAAALAQQASIEMLEARRAERNYLLLHDISYLQMNRDSLNKVKETLDNIRNLGPANRSETERADRAVDLYQKRFAAAVAAMGSPGQAPSDRIRAVVLAYEKDLDDLLKKARYRNRSQLIDDLRKRVGSFDSQITETVQEGNPGLGQVTEDLQTSSQEILQASSEIESQNWKRVQADHEEARRLISHAEWALGIVSALTLLASIWISFILPRQVVKPLVSLKEAVDHAATGNYEIEFDIRGEGEVVGLANSLKNLLSAVRHKQ
jgi:CHASE3 domain sensor protein